MSSCQLKHISSDGLVYFDGNGNPVNVSGIGKVGIRNAYGWNIGQWLNALSNHGIQIILGQTEVLEGCQVIGNVRRILIFIPPMSYCGNPILLWKGHKVRGNGWLRIANDITNALGLSGVSPIPVDIYVDQANQLVILEIK